jgi:hypothetical protein
VPALSPLNFHTVSVEDLRHTGALLRKNAISKSPMGKLKIETARTSTRAAKVQFAPINNRALIPNEQRP